MNTVRKILKLYDNQLLTDSYCTVEIIERWRHNGWEVIKKQNKNKNKKKNKNKNKKQKTKKTKKQKHFTFR